MQLHELMDPRIGTVSANDYAAEALYLMNSRNLNWCFVIDRDEVNGIIWAEDLHHVSDTLLKERDAGEFVTNRLLTIDIETDLSEVERLLQRSGQPAVAILKNNLPVGILNQETISRSRGSQPRGKQSAFSSHPSRQHPLAC